MSGNTMGSSQSTYQMLSGYHGTHIESPSNQGLEDICDQHRIFFVKNWTTVSSSPTVAHNNAYGFSSAKIELARILREKLKELLSSPEGIARIKSSHAMSILTGEFDSEVLAYIQTIDDKEKWKILMEEFGGSSWTMGHTRSWTSQNYMANRILAIIDWVKLNADGPVSVI